MVVYQLRIECDEDAGKMKFHSDILAREDARDIERTIAKLSEDALANLLVRAFKQEGWEMADWSEIAPIPKRAGVDMATLRKESGLSQAELAGLVGASRNQISKLENSATRRRAISLQMARRIAEVLGADLDCLFESEIDAGKGKGEA